MYFRNNRLLLFLISIIFIIMVGVKMLTPKWVSLYDIKYCSNLKYETITEITMMQTTDSMMKVVFSDEDLIEEWSSIFDSIGIKYSWKNTHFMERKAGGKPLLTVKTTQDTYRFAFNERSDGYLITIYSKRYLIKNPDIVRFREIYKEAVERHGTTSIF